MSYEKHVKSLKLVDPKLPCALWALQIIHLAQGNSKKEEHIFTDNFHTRHKLSKLVQIMTDNKVKITGILQTKANMFAAHIVVPLEPTTLLEKFIAHQDSQARTVTTLRTN